MGRLFKSGLDYFPLDTKMDDEIELIESEHGLMGFGVLIKLYQKIYASNYWIKWDKKTIIMFSNRINVDINEIDAVINSCLEWGIFDEKIFEKHQILTSTGIQKRYFEIIKRRQKVDILKEYLLVDYSKYLDTDKIDVNINKIDVVINSQSKVKEKKGKEKESNKYTLMFEKLYEEYPNTKGSKSQTFINYKASKKTHSMTEDQVHTACINSAKKQGDEGVKEGYIYQLSNVLGQKYSGDLPELLNYETPKLKDSDYFKNL